MSTKVKAVKSSKAAKATEKTGNVKSAAAAKAKAEAEAKKKIESYTKHSPGLLIDRHGDDCGYVIYSPYFLEKTILSLNDDAPRLITLETWERWGKQAKAFEKAAKKATKGLRKLSAEYWAESVTKYKAKTKPKAKAKKKVTMKKKVKAKKSDKKGGN